MKNTINNDLTLKLNYDLPPNTITISPYKFSANGKWYKFLSSISLSYKKDDNNKESLYYIVDNKYGIVATGETINDLMYDVSYYIYWFCCELYDKYDSHEIEHVNGDPKLNFYKLIEKCDDEPIYYIEQLDPDSRY